MELPKVNISRNENVQNPLIDILPGFSNNIIDDNKSEKSDNYSHHNMQELPRNHEMPSPRHNMPLPRHDNNEDDNISVQMSMGGYSEEMNSEEIMKKKRDYLRKLERYRKRGVKMSKIFTIEDSYEDIKIEYETQRREQFLETSLKNNKQYLCLAVSGIEWMNKKVNPIGAKLEGWQETVAVAVENGEYDMVLEELNDKYYDQLDFLPPELQLLSQLGRSAFMFHMGQQSLEGSGVNYKNLNHNTQQQINDILIRNGEVNKPLDQFNKLNSQLPGNPTFRPNQLKRSISKSNLSDHSIEAPSLDLLNELNMNTDMPRQNMNESKSQISTNANGQRVLKLV